MLNPNLLDAVRVEIREAETRLAKLRDIERLALELIPVTETSAPDKPRAPSPAPAKANGSSKPAPERLTVADVVDSARELLAKGPTSVNAIFTALGRSRTKRTEDIVLAAFEELGAVTAGSQRGGGVAYKLPDKPQPEPGAVSHRVRRELAREASGNGDAPELEDQVLDVIKRVGGRVALTEIEHQLRRRGVEFAGDDLEQAAGRLATHMLVVRDPGGGLRLSERSVEQAAMDAAGVAEL